MDVTGSFGGNEFVAGNHTPVISLLIPSICDNDLQRMLQSLKETSSNYDALDLVITHRRGNSGEVFEECYRQSKGDWIFLCNDDTVMETKDWDKILLEEIKSFPDEIVLFWPNDMIFRDQLSCFPIISRKVYNLVVDKIFPMSYRRYKVDDTIMDIFPHNRRIYLPNIVLRHLNISDHGPGFPIGNGKFYPNDLEALHDDGLEYNRRRNERAEVRAQLESMCQSTVML